MPRKLTTSVTNTASLDLTKNFTATSAAGVSYTYSSSSELRILLRFESVITNMSSYPSNDTITLSYEQPAKLETSSVIQGARTLNSFISATTTSPSGAVSATLLFGGGSSPENNITTFGDGSTDSPFSVSFWIKYTEAPPSGQRILFEKGRKSSGVVDQEYRLEYNNISKTMMLRLFDDSSSRQIVKSFGSIDLEDSLFHHIAITYDGHGSGSHNSTHITLYLDGVDQEANVSTRTDNGYTAMEPASDELHVGADNDESTEADAFLAEFAIFGKQLTSNEVNAIYHGQSDSLETTVNYNSGYTDLSTRIKIRDMDNRPGCYPTKHRMGDKDRSGKNNIFYEDLPIQFGNSIRDDFTNVPDTDRVTLAAGFDLTKWVVSAGMTIKREAKIGNTGEEIIDRSATFSGHGTSGKRFLRTAKPVRNITKMHFDLIQGPYNESPGLLNLRTGNRIETLKLEISTDSTFSTPKTIATYTPDSNFERFYGESYDINKPPRKSVSLSLSDFPDPGQPFYLRFVQETFDPDKTVWAIPKIDIYYANQNIRYPLLLNHATGHNKFVSSSIVTPHTDSDLSGIGRGVKGVSDVVKPFQSFNETISPFNETLNQNAAARFYSSPGVPSEVYPGFSSPVKSKTKFTFDLPCNEKIEFGYIDAIQSTNANFQSDTSGIGQKLMIYYNKDLKRWEKIGHPVHINNVTSPSANTLAEMMSQSCVGFGSSIDTFSKGLISGDQRNITEIYDQSFLNMSNKKITDFNFPFGQQYFGSSSYIMKAKDLGITKPFLLENVSLNFSSSFFFGFDTATNDYNELFSLKMLDRTDTTQSVVASAGIELIVPTFFMLRQYKDNIAHQSQNIIANTNSYGFNAATSFELPKNSSLDPDNRSNITYVDSSRELITYGQLGLFLSGTDSTAPGTGKSFELDNSPIQPHDLINHGLSFDLNKIINWDGTPASNGRRSMGADGSFTINFPARINTLVKKETSVMRMGLASLTSPYTDQLFLSNNFTYNEGNLKNSRRIVNGTSSQKASGKKEIFPDFIESRPPITVASPDINQKISPYLILPEDELIFGWQYPLAANPGKHSPGSSDDNSGTPRMYHMRLFDNTKLEFYGSLVVENKEFHETINQNLTSCAVYEHIIGDEKVVDQWQVAYRGELSGSLAGQCIFNDNSALDRNNPEAWNFAFGNDWTLDKANNSIYRRPSLILNEILNNSHPKKRIGSLVIQGGRSSIRNLYKRPPINASDADADLIAAAYSAYLTPIRRHIVTRDNDRVFIDSNFVFGEIVKNSTYGGINSKPVSAAQGITTSDPFYISSNANPKFYTGTKPQHVFSSIHFGHSADMYQQGKDSKFEPRNVNPTNPEVKVSSEPPVKLTQGSFVQVDTQSGIKQYSSKPTELLLDTFSFQSSNLNQYMTSSMPFIDDNTVRNRTYIEREFIPFSSDTVSRAAAALLSIDT